MRAIIRASRRNAYARASVSSLSQAGGSGGRLLSSSANVSFSCICLLLVSRRRLIAPLKKSVGHKAQMLKICEPADGYVVCRRVAGGNSRIADIRPRHGNVAAAAIG